MDFFFFFFYFNEILNKYLKVILFKFYVIFFFLNYISIQYLNYFFFIKFSSFFQMVTLSDLTVVQDLDYKFEFELLYITLSYKLNYRFFTFLLCKKEDLIISLGHIYSNALWLEREIWDLFGIKFIYHKDLRRILTDYGFVGHPLLKLYPLMGFMELRYDDALQKIIQEILELSQAYRFFTYINPWTKWYN